MRRYVVDPFGTTVQHTDPRHGWRVIDTVSGGRLPILAVYRTAPEAEALADLLNEADPYRKEAQR